MKRIVSLWFPKLSTDRLARASKKASSKNEWSARAAATIVWRDGCPRLAGLNAHARTAGLRPHMRLADARALLPDLVIAPGEPQADQRLIEAIADWCDRYTPWVTIDPLGGALAEEGAEACSAGGFGGDAGLLLDITGCAHLFGHDEDGERALLADLVGRLARHDFTCRAAMADTAGAAWALARYAERQADLFCPRHGQRDALLHQMRAQGTASEVVLITAFADLDTAIEALRAGAGDFLLKPFRVAQVLGACRQVLDRARLKRENWVLKRALCSSARRRPMAWSAARRRSPRASRGRAATRRRRWPARRC